MQLGSPPQSMFPLPRVGAGDVWSFDFISSLPKTKHGNQYLLTSIDMGTGFTFPEPLVQRCSVHFLIKLKKNTHPKYSEAYILHRQNHPLKQRPLEAPTKLLDCVFTHTQWLLVFTGISDFCEFLGTRKCFRVELGRIAESGVST
jgi:hypothetical protein